MIKPKLLIVTDTYFPLRDGVLKSIEEFIHRSKNDFEITLLVPKISSKKIPGINTVFFEISKKFKTSLYPLVKFSFENLKHIKKTIKSNDIIFSHGPTIVGFFLAVYYARRYKKKAVFYIHNTAWDFLEKYLNLNQFFSMMLKKFFVWLYNRWNMLLVPYREIESELRRAGVKTQMKVARLGVNINHFTPTENKAAAKTKINLPHKTIITYVGRICKEKNTSILLEAFTKLDPKKYFLLIVGDGTKEIVAKFKATKNCQVTGFVADVRPYLNATDIFIMPSLTETTSLATLEAMASGLPVIATKVGYIKNYLVKNHNGVFFPRNSATMLALKITKISEDHDFRRKLGKNARKTAAYAFSWERSINKMKKLLKED